MTIDILLLQLCAGRITKEKLAFAASVMRSCSAKKVHFTACQNLKLLGLELMDVAAIKSQARASGVSVWEDAEVRPYNIMCSPLTGAEKGEYFNVMPYAEAAGVYTQELANSCALPGGLRISFSSTPVNNTYATFTDLGFCARPDKLFDVYSAGAFGAEPQIGLLIAAAVAPEKILYYIKATQLLKARYSDRLADGRNSVRFIREAAGSDVNYKEEFSSLLKEIFASGENLDLELEKTKLKKRDFKLISGYRVIPQKQPGLYAVNYHPQGGVADAQAFCALADYLEKVNGAELRLASDQSVYIINLTAPEAARVMALTPDSAYNSFTSSVACTSGESGQAKAGDPEALLQECFDVMATEYAASDALPQLFISGTPSSCSAHQVADIGLLSTTTLLKSAVHPAFKVYVNGCSFQGQEQFARELGVLLAEDVPYFLLEVGKHVAVSGKNYRQWCAENPLKLSELAGKYLAKIELLNKKA